MTDFVPQEGVQKEVVLEDDEPTCVRAMLYYCYDKDYETAFDGGNIAVVDGNLLLFHIQVYAMADKFMVQGLKSFSFSNFEKSLRSEWHKGKLADAIAFGYNLPEHDGLSPRQSINELCEENIAELVNLPDFSRALKEVPELSAFLLPVSYTHLTLPTKRIV